MEIEKENIAFQNISKIYGMHKKLKTRISLTKEV